MPLFHIAQGKLSPIAQGDFKLEKNLQHLIESNLTAVFNSRLIASEYSTGALHAGRIDTLALSEDKNPVIIEYKKVESSDLINQSLFYLSWLSDHKGDFEIAAQKALGSNIVIDWSAIRVICIAPNFKRYDLHAVQMMGANIELWTYRVFANDSLYLEEMLHKSIGTTSSGPGPGVQKLTVGKKAALTKATGSYSFQQHLDGQPQSIRELALAVNDYIVSLDPSIQVAPKKMYIAYKIAQNLVCMVVQKKRVALYLKLDPTRHSGPPGLSKDVTDIGHFGTGDLEISLQTESEFELSKPFIKKAYNEVGA